MRTSVAVLSSLWGIPYDEEAFAMRGIAAAVSRFATVAVLVPGHPRAPIPDGGFDLTPIGLSQQTTGWPQVDICRWPAQDFALAVTAARDTDSQAIVARYLPDKPKVSIASGMPSINSGQGSAVATQAINSLFLALPEHTSTVQHVGLHVPVNPLAATRPHVGLGFTDYLLVLSDRVAARATDSPPTPLAAWLAARFADRHVVVVEDAVASVWRWRSLRGAIHVDTRMDLWRLIAHARALVDLAPGPLIARECVESLRYGVPIVVPANTPAARLARQGGGLWFENPAELLGCVHALDDDSVQKALGNQGRGVANKWYGDGLRFLERMEAAFSHWFQ